jgi:hypothetical protein
LLDLHARFGVSAPMLAAMTETAAGSVTPEAPPQEQDLRERATLIGFVVVATLATFAWLALLGWLAIEGLQALGA